jgi:hypothetical protein
MPVEKLKVVLAPFDATVDKLRNAKGTDERRELLVVMRRLLQQADQIVEQGTQRVDGRNRVN